MCSHTTAHIRFALAILAARFTDMNHRARAATALGLALGSSLLLSCSGGDGPPSPPVEVSVSAESNTVEAGGSVPLSAIVANDPRNRGVTWALNGPGTLSDFSSTSATYHAPADPLGSDTEVSVVAIAKADRSKQSVATIEVLALSVSVSASESLVPAGGSTIIEARVVSDPSQKGVMWMLSPAAGAGTLSDATSTSITYTAPDSAPATDLSVTVTATSMADSSKAGELILTVPQIRVSVSPNSSVTPVGAQQDFAATVLYDSQNAGVKWSLVQGMNPCSPACGTIAPIKEASTTYSAPGTAPTEKSMTLVATSVTNPAASGSATIVLAIGTVKLVPSKLNFGTVSKRGKSMQLALTNTGSDALAITEISITEAVPATQSSPFTQANDCGVSVAATASCTINVRFKPFTKVGSYGATLSISDSSADSPQLVALSGCVGTGCTTAAAQFTLATPRIASVPAPTGPNTVGTLILDLTDGSRDDAYLANGAKREVLVRLWYPSARQGCRLAEYASPQVWKFFSELAGVPLPRVTTNSCRDARIADGVYPVVVFTHGFTGTFTDYTYLFEDLASRGYVVASVDHTYEATAVSFPDGRFAKSALGSHLSKTMRTDPQTLAQVLSVRLGDLSFVLDELEHLNRAPGGPLASHLDLSSVAIAGHSLGGLAALKAIEREPRFRAAISLDGLVPDDDFRSTDSAVLMIDADRELWPNDERLLWNKLRGPRLALNLKGSEHLALSDAVWLAKGAVVTGTMTPEKTIAAIREYVAAFLDANLLGGAPSRLLTVSPPDYPDVEVTSQSQSPCCKSY